MKGKNHLDVVKRFAAPGLRSYGDLMEQLTNSTNDPQEFIQYMGDRVRQKWSNKFPLHAIGSPVKTRYPNLLAELAFTGMHITNPPARAQVTNEIFAAVLEDGEELTDWETKQIAALFRVKPWYIQQDTLFMVEPLSDEHSKLYFELDESTRYPEFHLTEREKELCLISYLALDQGISVPWAAFNEGERWLSLRLLECRELRNPPKKRGVRLSQSLSGGC